MRYIKNFKVFESNWTQEEYIEDLRSRLSKYNISPVEIRELIKRTDIESAINDGIQPLKLAQDLIDDMDLKSRGDNNFTQFRIGKPLQSEIKYL